MKNLWTLVLALGLAVLLSGAAQASISTITYTSAEFNSGFNGTTFTALVPKFNPGLGTLQSVTLALNVSVDPSAFVDNDKLSGSVTAIAYTEITQYTLLPLNWTDPYGNNGMASPYYYIMPTRITVPAQTIIDSSDPIWQVEPTLTANVPAGNIGDYIGAGDYNLLYNVNGNADAGGAVYTGGLANVSFGSDYTVDGTVTVTYDYTTAVPAPAALLLGLLGLSGLAALRRRLA